MEPGGGLTRRTGMTRSRFAIVFATTAVVAALAGGVAGMVAGQSGGAAPTAPAVSVGAVQTEPVAPTANGVVAPATRTVTVVRTAPAAQPVQTAPNVPTAAKPVKERKVTESEHTTPQSEPVQTVEVDPTPTPDVPYATDGTPTSMNGVPDPMVPAVSEPEATPTPLHK